MQHRPDLLIIDDVIDPKMPVDREIAERWFRKCRGKAWRGPIHKDDLLDWLTRESPRAREEG